VTETLTRNDVTVKGLLVGLTAHGCDWKAEGCDAWTGRCPSCRGSLLSIRVTDDGFEVECPSTGCTSDVILNAAFADPEPTSMPESVPEPESAEVAPSSSPVLVFSESFSSSQSFESCGSCESSGSCVSMGTPLEETIGRAIVEAIAHLHTLAADGRKRSNWKKETDAAWVFVRFLKAIDEFKSRPVSEVWSTLMPAITEFHSEAKQSLEKRARLPSDKEDFEAQVVSAWSIAKLGIDENTKVVAVKLARERPYRPEELGLKASVLAAVCRNLAMAKDEDGLFFLSQRDAADAISVASHRIGGDYLKKLEQIYAVIRLHKPGTRGENGTAAWYRWIGPVD
jgi:hypothetical protein